MNPHRFIRNLVILALTCLALGSCQTNQSGGPGTRNVNNFTLHRQADLGVDLILSIDGKGAGVVRVADTYNGFLAPGPHVISVIPAPNEYGQAAATANLTVDPGKKYSFIAVRRGSRIVLVNEF